MEKGGFLASKELHCKLCDTEIVTGSRIFPYLFTKENETSLEPEQNCIKQYWVHLSCIPEKVFRTREKSLNIPVCKHFLKRGVCIYQDTEQCMFRHPQQPLSCNRKVLPRRGTRKRLKVYNENRASVLRLV